MPSRRLILLGASNLTRGFALALQTARTLWHEPLDIMAAAGHGRSYGAISRVLIRSLPGILQCGLWDDLARRPPLPGRALVTDIGNDLFYGAQPEQIAGWVAICVDRLAQAGLEPTVSALPLCNLPHVSCRRYNIMVRLFFPGCRMNYDAALERTCELDQRVRELAAERGLPVAEPQRPWYGADPLHVRMRFVARAWQALLTAGMDAPVGLPLATVKPGMFMRAALVRPQQRWMFGIEQRQQQPAWTWLDGTRVSVY